MRYKQGSSEIRCAVRMYEIFSGRHPQTKETYTVREIAERDDLHRDTVYKSIRAGDPMLPLAQLLRERVRPRLVVRRDAVVTCDQNRLVFYRTTPSWSRNFIVGSPQAPPRRSARVVLNELTVRTTVP